MHTWWCHNVNDVINHLLLSRTITGISFMLIPLVETKLFNFVIFVILVCKIHRKQMAGKWQHFSWSIIEDYYWCKIQVHTVSNSWDLKNLWPVTCDLWPAFFTNRYLLHYSSQKKDKTKVLTNIQIGNTFHCK